MIFSVENYADSGRSPSGGRPVTQRRETRNRAEAERWAKETPHSSIATLDENGWVIKPDEHFSPKHPVGVRGNPELAVMALGANPPEREQDSRIVNTARGQRVEYAWQVTGGQGMYHRPFTVYAETEELASREAQRITSQLKRTLSVYPIYKKVAGNPPGEVFGADVFAVVYLHKDDGPGDVRVHLFGKGGKWRETRDGSGVEVYNLPNATGVYMAAEGERRVVMQHRRGLPLVKDF